MSKTKDIKVVYYVDIDDDTNKGTLCAIPSDKDMRDKEVVDFIANEIHAAFVSICHVTINDSKELAKGIAYHEYASVCEYEFGVEEIPLLEC
jgi:hypothetical protein